MKGNRFNIPLYYRIYNGNKNNYILRYKFGFVKKETISINRIIDRNYIGIRLYKVSI